MTTHLFIPDNQVKADVPLDHLRWIGQYIVDKKPDVVINIGDFADMPSLSSYDKGKKAFEGRRVMSDIEATHKGMDTLMKPLEDFNTKRRTWKMKQYKPRLVMTLGNHEDRISRAIENNAELDGILSLDDLDYKDWGWEVIPFKESIVIDGVYYSHFFYNPYTGRPWGGMVATRLKNIGHSFSMGHVQTLDYATRFLSNGQQQCGLVAGACYLHFEDYKGAQANYHWRGIVMKHQVKDGAYDPMFVSLDYLCRRYEGMPLSMFMAENYPEIKGVV